MYTKEIGKAGEQAAEKYLKKQRYRILARNFTDEYNGGGEIDLVVMRGGVLAFVEVKTRTSDRYGEPAFAVGVDKMRSIIQTADCFEDMFVKYYKISIRPFYLLPIITKHRIKKFRYDVVEVFMTKEREVKKITHHEGFFNRHTPNWLEKRRKRYKYKYPR